jgi:hypothetical protein
VNWIGTLYVLGFGSSLNFWSAGGATGCEVDWEEVIDDGKWMGKFGPLDLLDGAAGATGA